MPNFWEPKPFSHWAHGFLICGGTQSSGNEFHGSFPRDGGLPHISIYKIGKRQQKLAPNLWFVKVNGTVGLNQTDRATFLSSSGVSESTMNDFLKAVWDKHRALNPVNVTSAAQKKPTVSDFPALPGSKSTPIAVQSKMKATVPAFVPNVTPPMLTDRPVGLSAAGSQQWDELSASMQGVLAQSGAFE